MVAFFALAALAGVSILLSLVPVRGCRGTYGCRGRFKWMETPPCSVTFNTVPAVGSDVMSVDSDSVADATSDDEYSASALLTERAKLDQKMPDSVTEFTRDLQRATGRTFKCPNCGEPSTGTCGECGYRHPQMREDKR